MMSSAVKDLLSSFDRLENSEKHKALSALLHRLRELEFDAPSDEELVITAESTFLELDQREESNA